jgi:hypothetical protein
MTRYDWSKLTDGWQYRADQLPGPTLCMNNTSFWTLDFLERNEMSMGSEHMLALDQLAKCRIEPVDVDTRNEKILTEENERLKVDNMRLRHLWRDADLARSISEGQVTRLTEQVRKLQEKPSDWRDEVRQACEGVDGIREPYQARRLEITVRPTVFGDHEAFRLVCTSSREYVLFDGVRTIEGALQLSIVVERLKKLGWTEAK